jgi:predicted TPR repeat methyltransferase
MSVDKMLKKAIAKHENLEYEEAGKLYRTILSTKPRHLDANYLLGTLYAECGDFEKAKQHLAKAALIDPHSPMVQVNLGNVYRKLGSSDLAVKYFSRARQLMPTLYQAHLGLGSALLELNQDFDKAAECFQRALSLAPYVPEIYQQMGQLLARNGNFDEALRMFEVARSMNPGFPDINFDMGLICLRGDRKEAAAECFREACRIAPDKVNAAFFLEIAEGRAPGTELMQKFAQTVFDGYASVFEKHIVETLQYTLPIRVLETLKELCGDDFHFDSVVDLGCGTGLTVEALRGATNLLTGIDISEKMIAVARSKGCFDQLYCGDLVTTLNAGESRYDLFVATDVLVYLGEMDPLMPAILSHAAPGALFLFSTENHDGEGLLLQKSGRYAHSSGYVHDIMKAHDCTVISEDVIDLRLEGGSWLKGNLFVARLP